MRKLLVFIIALMVLATFSGIGFAQQKAQEGGSAGEKKDKASPKLMTGKVLEINAKAQTFTVTAKGKEVTFSAAKLKALPKVGEIIDITYTENPNGPAEATNLNSSRSNIY
ncbi:MAG TPA: hypothetical protein VJZ02_04150 [Candidatus Brocadiales bacterium]|nr:hypothetical protein [Candidatus Brocadiales bacterium]